MQFNYNRKPSLRQTILKAITKLLMLMILIIFAVFLIEKINFPSPEKKNEIDITNEIKKL
jgi:hypothetical protein